MTEHEWLMERLRAAGQIKVVGTGLASPARRPMRPTTLPLSIGYVATLEAPLPLTAEEYDRMLHALTVLRSGLVKE